MCLNILGSGYGVIIFLLGWGWFERGRILVFGVFPRNMCMIALLEFDFLDAPSWALDTSDRVSSFELADFDFTAPSFDRNEQGASSGGPGDGTTPPVKY